MKHFLPLLTVATISAASVISNASGIDAVCVGTPVCPIGAGRCVILRAQEPTCTLGVMRYYDTTGIFSCSRCETGYELTQQRATVPNCSNEILFNVCRKPCDGTCSDCTTSAWTAGNTGYQKRTYASCNTATCVCTKTAQYRCAAGYYGTSSNGTSGCTRCPSNGSSTAGATAITSCYLPSGTTGSDSTGSYTYTSNCYYSN